MFGLTGPSGAGKTTALRAVSDLGGAVIDCDAVYHGLTKSCAPMLRELRERFGDGVFDGAGALDRKALAALAFGDETELAALNAITHRYVAGEVDRLLDKARAEGRSAAAVDAIALLESGLAARCDLTVAVTAPEESRLRRIMARDQISEERARARVAAQKPSEWFEARCVHTLRNDGEDPSAFYEKAKAFFQNEISKGGA